MRKKTVQKKVTGAMLITASILLVLAGCSTGNDADTTAPEITSFSYSPDPAVADTSIDFFVGTDDSNATVTYDFNNNGNFVSGNTYTFSQTGNQNITVQVEDLSGNVVMETYTVPVLESGTLTVENNTTEPITVYIDGVDEGQVAAGAVEQATLAVGTYTIRGVGVDSGNVYGPSEITLTTDGYTYAFTSSS